MKIVIPAPLTLVSTNIPEPDTANGDPAVYDSGTTYNTGDKACVLATHRIYEALADGVVGVFPPDDLSSDTPKWAVVDTTNRWKALDAGLSNEDVSVAYIDTQSVQPGEISYEVGASKCSLVALFNVQAEKITFSVKEDGVVVEGPHEVAMVEATATNFYEWYFSPIRMRRNVLHGFGAGLSQTLVIQATSSGGSDVKIGSIIVGNEQYVGSTKSGVKGSIEGYAVEQRDSYGRWYVRKGLMQSNAELTLYIDAANISWVKNLFSDMTGVPTVFIHDNVDDVGDAMECLIQFGLIDGFEYPLERKSGKNECTLKCKGLT